MNPARSKPRRPKVPWPGSREEEIATRRRIRRDQWRREEKEKEKEK